MNALIHVASAVCGLVLGALVFVNTKGARAHRTLGILYSASMLVTNFTALGIYHLTGRFNLFHVTAFVSLAMVATGWAQVLLRHRLRNWLYRHYIYMCWSYVALVAAAFNEGFVRLTPLKSLVHNSGNWVIIATQVVLLSVAALLINRRKAEMLKRYGTGASPAHGALLPDL
jgi:uncharacterized membrane protein